MITIIDGIPADTRVLDRMCPDAKTIGDIVDAFRHDYANDSFQEYREDDYRQCSEAPACWTR